MTLLVFGAVPVDSFAQTRYLKVPTENNNWDNGSGTVFDGNTYTATKTGVEIGTSKFGISVWSGSFNTWYKTGTNRITPGQTVTLQTNGTTTTDDEALVKSKSLFTVVGAVAGEKYDVQVKYTNSSYTTATLTLIPDYSKIKCTFGHKAEDGNWGQYEKKLAKDGTLTYRFNTRGQGGFNITLDRNGTQYTFPAGALTADDFSDNQYVYDGSEHGGGYNKWCTDISKNYISGLKTNTEYEVIIDFLTDTMVIREIPVELYITGEPTGGWEPTNFAKNEYLFSFENGKYVYEFDYDENAWFAINEGSESKNRWYVQSNNANLSLPVEGATLVYTDYATNKLGNNYSGRIRITVDWDAKKAWIEEVKNSSDAYLGYQVRVHYGNGNTSDYQTVTQDNLVTDEENGDKWIVIDRGFLDRGLENVGESYDGLGLGYLPFCIETLSPEGRRRYWAYGDAKDYGVYVDNGLPMKDFTTKQEAMAQNMHMAETAGNANSRYDVAFNLTDNMMTASLNQIWADSPNQMYLYCLDSDEYSKDADGNYVYDADKINIANILSVINSPTNNKIFAFTRSREGLYENVFLKDNKKDLPDGTVFCIIGRTGQIYNLIGENNNAFQLTKDNWDVFRHELTRDPKQAPAVVATGEDLLLDIDCFARVRTPNTLEGDDANENYMLTFTRKIWSPVKFTLTTDVNATEGLDFTKVDDELFTLDDEKFTTGTKLYIKATLENGDIVSYGTNNNVTVSSNEYEANISKDKTSSITINTKGYENGSRVRIEWNNGAPKILFRPKGEKKEVKIFFIDRAGWGSVYCYNYSDAGLTSKGHYTDGDATWNKNENWGDVEVGADHRNDNWPGSSMTICNMNILRQGVEMDPNDKIYEMTLDVDVYADGTYSRPKLIFSDNGSKQTKNLYLVDGGIYCNDSPMKNVTDEDGNTHKIIEHAATVYMPRMQYNYMDNPLDQSVSEYPNDFHDSDYVEIFVNVPEFTDWVAHGKDMAVDIVYKKDGEEFHATGIPGTHKLYAEKVNGKNLLRVAIAKDVIPNNTKVDLRFWPVEIDGKKRYEGYYNDGSQHKIGDDVIDEKDHNGSHTNCTVCTDSKGVTYHGDHFTCWGSLCPLEFVGVNYKDGNVYQRYLKSDNEVQDPVVTVADVLKPKHLYIVTSDITSFEYARKNGFVSGTKQKVGNFDNCYELLKTDPSETGKLNYLLPRVYPDAKLYLVAEREDGIVSYSRPTATAMKPGNPYKYFEGLKTNFTIDNREYLAVKNFDMTIYWLNNEIGVTANKTQAEFTFVEYVDNDGEGKYEPREGGAICLPGHTDSCLEEGNNHLTNIYFQYAPGYDLGKDGLTDYSRLNNLKVELRRNTEYEKYFPVNGMNKKAEIVRDDNGIAIHVVEDSYIDYDDPINNKPGIAYLNVIGYTANLTTLHIEQTETDTQFQRSAINIPVRIFPTIESIGMIVNDEPVTTVGGVYSVKVPTHAHVDGNAQFGDRLQFEAEMAEYKLDGQNILSYSWSYDPDITRSVASRPQSRIASNPSSFPAALHVANAETDPFTTDEYNTTDIGTKVETTPFSIHNAPRIPLGASTSPTDVYLKINQNGISSPLYKVAVTRDADVNIPTEVEEILGVDEEVAPVYYNLNGVRVDAERLEPGIYVKVTGTKSEKVYVK